MGLGPCPETVSGPWNFEIMNSALVTLSKQLVKNPQNIDKCIFYTILILFTASFKHPMKTCLSSERIQGVFHDLLTFIYEICHFLWLSRRDWKNEPPLVTWFWRFDTAGDRLRSAGDRWRRPTEYSGGGRQNRQIVKYENIENNTFSRRSTINTSRWVVTKYITWQLMYRAV